MAEREPNQPDVLPVFKTRDETRAFYDKISRVYDLLAERSEGPMRAKGLELLAVRPGERALEIGCGTGHCLVELARAVGPQGRVWGLDLSSGMLSRARRLLEREGLADVVSLELGDASELPHPDETLDALFVSFTLELFATAEIPRVLDECRRVLRPGGRIGVVGMSRGDGHDPMLRVYEWTHRHFPNFVDCRPIHVQRALEQADFEITEARTEHMWVPVEIVVGRKRPGAPAGHSSSKSTSTVK